MSKDLEFYKRFILNSFKSRGDSILYMSIMTDAVRQLDSREYDNLAPALDSLTGEGRVVRGEGAVLHLRG